MSGNLPTPSTGSSGGSSQGMEEISGKLQSLGFVEGDVIMIL